MNSPQVIKATFADPQVVKATFADWRPVKGRKQLQLIFEVPLELTGEVLEMLGAPMPDKETWCAIALLDMQLDNQAKEGGVGLHQVKFWQLPFPQQAALKSKDEKFAEWLGVRPGDDCAQAIRERCCVDSRSKIIKGTAPGNEWTNILREYEAYR